MPAPRLQIAILLALVGCKRVEREDKPAVDDWKDRYHEPTVLTDKQPGPSDIAVDATHIYWTHIGKPLVRRMPRTGGAVETVYEGTGELGGMWLALDRDDVYFTESAFNIRRVPKAGGDAALIGIVAQVPARFAADADAVYSASASVTRHPRTGGETRIAAGSELWDVGVDATHVYWLDRGGVYRAPKTGGQSQQLARGVFRFGKLALSDTDVFWGDAVLESIFAIPKAGGAPRFIAHAWNIATRELIPDGSRLWVLQSGGNLQLIDLTTREITTVAVAMKRGGSADNFFGMAVTPETVFVAAGGQSLVGTGPVVIDMTNPNAKLPDYTYDGAILTLPTTLPKKPLREPAGDLYVALVYFSGTSADFQDRNNAIRWIDESGEAYSGVKTGELPLKIIANTRGVSKEIALERATKVEAAVREKLGPKAVITLGTEVTEEVHGEVRIVLEETALLAWFAQTGVDSHGRGPEPSSASSIGSDKSRTNQD